MYGFKQTSLLATLGALFAVSAAAPQTPGWIPPSAASLSFYVSDSCDDKSPQMAWGEAFPVGSSGCLAVQNANTFRVIGNGNCQVSHYSGDKCDGFGTTVFYNECNSAHLSGHESTGSVHVVC